MLKSIPVYIWLRVWLKLVRYKVSSSVATNESGTTVPFKKLATTVTSNKVARHAWLQINRQPPTTNRALSRYIYFEALYKPSVCFVHHASGNARRVSWYSYAFI